MPPVVHYFGVLLCCLFLLLDSQNMITFEAQNNPDGNWSFREGSTAILVCKIMPYTGVQTFFYNSMPVFGCTFSECEITEKRLKEFSFTNDTASGTFTWKISPINMEFNGKMFKCKDENNSVEHKMEGYGKDASEKSRYGSFQKLHILPEERDCLKLYQKGYSADGVYVIYPASGVPVEAWCDMTGGGWTVIQRRQDGSEDFYRGWDDYAKGFDNRTGEYWLGLENIHIMSQENSSLRIELEAFDDRLPKTAFAEYSSFQIGSSLTNYTLTISGYFGDCGDSMAYHKAMSFTTKDRKNDLYSTNCAVIYKGAWWYKMCHHSNLNGLYLGPGTTTFGVGMNWLYCWGHTYSVKKSVMKIRRNIV